MSKSVDEILQARIKTIDSVCRDIRSQRRYPPIGYDQHHPNNMIWFMHERYMKYAINCVKPLLEMWPISYLVVNPNPFAAYLLGASITVSINYKVAPVEQAILEKLNIINNEVFSISKFLSKHTYDCILAFNPDDHKIIIENARLAMIVYDNGNIIQKGVFCEHK